MNSAQISVGRDADQQFVINLFVDFKLGMAFEIFPNRRFGIVSWAPNFTFRVFRVKHGARFNGVADVELRQL